MRLILFGAPDAAAALLHDEEVRDVLRSVAEGGNCERSTLMAPQAAVDIGLLARTGNKLTLGPRIHRPTALDLVSAERAGAICADRVGRSVGVLRAVYESTGSWHGPWSDAAVLVVAGLLLDLFVGQSLVDQGLVRPPAKGWQAWMLPPAHASVGIRMRYDRGSKVGCGVMWMQHVEDDAELLGDADLRGVMAIRHGQPDAATLLRLRYQGWMRRDGPAFLLLRDRDNLWQALTGIARELVETVHRPMFPPDEATGDGHAGLARSRLVLEHALAALCSNGTVTPPQPSDLQRFCWSGPDWRLRAASAGEDGHDA